MVTRQMYAHCFSMKQPQSPQCSITCYKAILGLLPYYLCVLIKQKSAGNYSLRSQDCFMLTVPNARTEIGKRAFMYSAPSAWNILQKVLKRNYFSSLNAFKLKMKKLEILSDVNVFNIP